MAIGFSQNFGLKRETLSLALRAFSVNSVLSRGDLMSKIGVGDNEAEAIVTWLGKLGLRNNKKRALTSLARIIVSYDPYLHDMGSAWLLHYQLSQNADAEVWYYITNKFLPANFEFTFQEALGSLQSIGIGQKSPIHLKTDIRIYLKALTEPNVLGNINFLRKIDEKIYQKGSTGNIHPYLIAYVIYDQRDKQNPTISTMTITGLLSGDGNAGKVFLLNREKLEKILQKLRFENLIDVSHTADLDQVGFVYKGSALSILEKYYCNR